MPTLHQYSIKHLSFWQPFRTSKDPRCNKKVASSIKGIDEPLEMPKHGGAKGMEKTPRNNRNFLASLLQSKESSGKSQRAIGMFAKMSTQTIKGSPTIPTEFAPAEFTQLVPTQRQQMHSKWPEMLTRRLKIPVTDAEDRVQQNLNRRYAMQFVEDAIVSNDPAMLRQAVVHVKDSRVARVATVSLQRLQVHADCLEAAELLRTAVACGSEDTSLCRHTLTLGVRGHTGRALKHLTETCDVKRRLCTILRDACVDDLLVAICDVLMYLLQYELRIEHRRCQRLDVLEMEKTAQRVKEHLSELIDNKMKNDEDAIVPRIWAPLVQKPLLLDLRMPGGCSESLLDMIKNTRGETWVDCSLWELAPKQDLPHVARILHSRGGLLAWPFAWMFKGIPWHSDFDETEREQLWSDASQAALRVLRSLVDETRDFVKQAKCREISLGKIIMLERIIHYAEEFDVASLEIESARRALSELKKLAACQKKASQMKWNKVKVARNALGLAFQSEHIPCNNALNALVGMGLTEEEADVFLSYADCARKGFITLHDFTQVFERRKPAGPREMCKFVDFIKQYWGSYEAAFYSMSANIDDDMQISVPEFVSTMEGAGWKDVPPRAIFVTLDPMKRGCLDLDALLAAELFESIHILELWQEVRDTLLKRFGTFKEAVKALDGNKSNALSYEEFLQALKELKIPCENLKREMFHFLDMDASGIVSAAEVEGLQNYNATRFMRTLLNLRNELVHKFGDLETAFGKIDTSHTDRISLEEFKRGCKRVKLSEFSDIDPRLLYHFLDRTHTCSLSKKEWLNLNYFQPPRAAADSGKHQLFLKNLFGTTDPKKAYISFQAKVNETTSMAAIS